MKRFSLYVLRDPDTGHIRYIGQTCRGINVRFSKHKREAMKSTKHKLYAWIKGLLIQGKEPICEEVFSGCTKDQVNDAEYSWIALFRSSPYLLNRSDGGATNSGWNHSEEQKEKWRRERVGEDASHYGFSQPEHVKEASRVRLKKMLEERGHPMKGKKHSEESRRKISESRKGITPNWTEEGKEKRKAAAKKLWENPEYVEKIKAVQKKNTEEGKYSGLNSGRSTLSLKDVWNIFYARCSGMVIRDIAEKYNTSETTVSFICRKKSYKEELKDIVPVVLVS